jgi:hypothetical protein
VQLVFDNWYPFSAQAAPSLYAGVVPDEVYSAIKHNQLILVDICLSMNVKGSSALLYENRAPGWKVPELKKLFSTAVNYKNKYNKGIISSWRDYLTHKVSDLVYTNSYDDLYTNSYNTNSCFCLQDKLWIHHWVVLQFVNPNMAIPLGTDLTDRSWNFVHDNWKQFVTSMSGAVIDNFLTNHSGEEPKFGLVWLGTLLDV